ncbi:nucleoside diphosphate kinase regulator [Niveibacterium sp. SC-1]|uniref:nucleoside diphosphate kinase regulator n=1 Tax=Niveibacterium sp. SC-1 TaxID=3135646 RepID=UPI00311F4477
MQPAVPDSALHALPSIVVSSFDQQRLEALLERLDEEGSTQGELLAGELLRACVVAPQEIPPDVVTMNSVARFILLGAQRELELTLCFPRDVDGSPGKVSILAPVGMALLGLRVGDEIDWPLPGGRSERIRLLAVSYQPERSGHMDR